MTLRIVTDFQPEFTFESLPIGDPSLSLHASAPSGRVDPPDLGIPGSTVALDGERNFDSPAKGWMKPDAEAFEQCQLRRIADRIAGGVGSNRKVQAHDRTPRTNVRDVQSHELSTLEAQELGVRGAGCGGTRPKTEPGGNPGVAMLASQSTQHVARSTSTTIGWAFPSCHRCSLAQHPSLGVVANSSAPYRSPLRLAYQATDGIPATLPELGFRRHSVRVPYHLTDFRAFVAIPPLGGGHLVRDA